jgi:hypothetical protein
MLKWFVIVVGALCALIAVAFFLIDEPLPEGRAGPEADALASRLEQAVNIEAWHRTGAVRWEFAGRQRHLWDRTRKVARVQWGDTTALVRLDDQRGRAYHDGQELQGDEARRAIERAYAFWVNDSFWLNPLAMFRGDAVQRELVRLEDGGEGLLITFSSGGLTPGDSYLWLADENGLPRAWRMWVSIIPIGGVATSWEGWQTLSTGARVATTHVGPIGLTIELTDVAGAPTLSELVDGPDPFEPLFELIPELEP